MMRQRKAASSLTHPIRDGGVTPDATPRVSGRIRAARHVACTVHRAAAVTRSTQPRALEPAESSTSIMKVAVASFIGTAIEWGITLAAVFIASETGKHQLDHA